MEIVRPASFTTLCILHKSISRNLMGFLAGAWKNYKKTPCVPLPSLLKPIKSAFIGPCGGELVYITPHCPGHTVNQQILPAFSYSKRNEFQFMFFPFFFAQNVNDGLRSRWNLCVLHIGRSQLCYSARLPETSWFFNFNSISEAKSWRFERMGFPSVFAQSQHIAAHEKRMSR